MSPPASAMACAIRATMPRWFLPVVVTTARPAARAARLAARSACRRAAPSATRLARPPRASPRRRGAAGRSSFTFAVDLHAIDDRDDRGVDRNGRLGSGRQLLADRDARRVPEGDQHVVARPRVQRVGADDQIVGRLGGRRARRRRAAPGGRSPRRYGAPAAASAPAPAATSPSTRPSPRRVRGTSARPFDDRGDGRVAQQIAVLRPGPQHVARARAERDRHVLAGARVERVAGDHQPPRRPSRRRRAPRPAAASARRARAPCASPRPGRSTVPRIMCALRQPRAMARRAARLIPGAAPGAAIAVRPSKSTRSTTPSTAASTGMSLPPADARAGAPRQTMTSSPTPASTSSVATRCRVAERRLVDRVRPHDQQLRPLQARVAPRRPDLRRSRARGSSPRAARGRRRCR